MHPKYYKSGRKPVYHAPFESEGGSGGSGDVADAFAALLDGDDGDEPAADAAPAAVETEQVDEQDADDQDDEDAQVPDDGAVTVEVDGKQVVLTKEQIAEAYKSGLRQSDYTKKTTEAAELKKQADAEIQKTRQERDNYAQRLATDTAAEKRILDDAAAQLTDDLLDSDPTGYLKLQRTLHARYAKLQQDQAELDQISQTREQEHKQAVQTYQAEQHQQLIAKLPEWQDATKAKAEAAQIKDFLAAQYGFSEDEIKGIGDHRLILLARSAMKLDQITTKAKDATKKIANLPPRVERPGNTSVRPTDGRTAAMKQLKSTGSVKDAANAFSMLL